MGKKRQMPIARTTGSEISRQSLVENAGLPFGKALGIRKAENAEPPTVSRLLVDDLGRVHPGGDALEQDDDVRLRAFDPGMGLQILGVDATPTPPAHHRRR